MQAQKFKCKCPKCGHEWTYIPRYGLPFVQVTCPKCHHKVNLRRCCTPA